MENINLPAFYHFFLGDIRLTALLDGTATVHTDKMMLFAEPGEVSALLEEHYAGTLYEASINAFIFEIANKKILIDTGAGDLMGPTAGHLLQSLKAAGFEPGDIDILLLTHIHGDHSGGLLHHGELAYPNAELHVSQFDFDYWLSEEEMLKVKPERQQSFRNAVNKVGPWAKAGKVKTFNTDRELFPGLTTWAQPGHTPGHTYYVLESLGNKLVFCADIVHVAEIQLSNPDIAIILDVDPEASVLKRREFLAKAAKERFWIAADHISFPGIGHVKAEGKGYTFIPAKYSVIAK
jgi:glyoxylase-like metal-dependent hydrolase (beta-lactamase superfamily II)